jgi:hypothetical protein
VRRFVLALIGAFLAVAPAYADHLDQTTEEVRLVLYYHVPDAALARRLPPGWVLAPLDSGAGKGANLTVNLSDELAARSCVAGVVVAPRGRGVTFSARVHAADSDTNRAMVLWGISSADVPGPYGTHQRGVVGMTRTVAAPGTAAAVNEAWNAHTQAGDRLIVDIAYQRGQPVPSHVEQQTRSSLHPDFFRIYKMDLLSDPLRGPDVTDRVRHVTVRFQGEPARLLAGAALVGVVSVPVYHRAIWLGD